VDFKLGTTPEGSELFLEGSRVDVLCTQLYGICFHLVLCGGSLGYNGSRYKKKLKTTGFNGRQALNVLLGRLTL